MIEACFKGRGRVMERVWYRTRGYWYTGVHRPVEKHLLQKVFRLSENLGQLAKFRWQGGEHTGKHRVDQLERLVDLFSHLGPGQHNLAADEDQQNDFGLHHAIDETGEQLGLIRAKVVMTAGKAFKADREFDVARANDVLDLEIRELGVEPKLLNDPSIFAGRELRVVFGLCASDNHLARGEDQSCGLRFADAHNNGRETLDMDLAQSNKLWHG